MNRAELISRLVDRKMTLSRPTKTDDLCFAAPARKLCITGCKPAAGGSKN